MLKVRCNAPRYMRSYLHRTLGEERKLYLLSPAQCGDTLWRFAVAYHGAFVLLGKGVANRDVGRVEGVKRYGVRASEYRRKAKAAA
jgi:hypothetical protein